jgi:hypothetical protein
MTLQSKSILKRSALPCHADVATRSVLNYLCDSEILERANEKCVKPLSDPSHNGTTDSEFVDRGLHYDSEINRGAEPHTKGVGHEKGTIYRTGCPR